MTLSPGAFLYLKGGDNMQTVLTAIIVILMLLTLTSLVLIAILSNFKWFKHCGYYQNRLHSYAAGAIALSVGLTYLTIH